MKILTGAGKELFVRSATAIADALEGGVKELDASLGDVKSLSAEARVAGLSGHAVDAINKADSFADKAKICNAAIARIVKLGGSQTARFAQTVSHDAKNAPELKGYVTPDLVATAALRSTLEHPWLLGPKVDKRTQIYGITQIASRFLTEMSPPDAQANWYSMHVVRTISTLSGHKNPAVESFLADATKRFNENPASYKLRGDLAVFMGDQKAANIAFKPKDNLFGE